MLFRKASLSKMVSFPKDKINIYKCRNFCDLVIYRGNGLSGRVAAAPAMSLSISSVSQVSCAPGELIGTGVAGGRWLDCVGRLMGSSHDG